MSRTVEALLKNCPNLPFPFMACCALPCLCAMSERADLLSLPLTFKHKRRPSPPSASDGAHGDKCAAVRQRGGVAKE